MPTAETAMTDQNPTEPADDPRPDGEAAPGASRTDSRTLRKLAISGSLWTVGGHVAGQTLRMGGHLVVAYLLSPEIFGVMVVVNVVILGLKMFSDVGIGPSIIHHRRGDEPRFLNTAWTIQLGRGVALFLVASLLAWPLSQFYDKPEYLLLIPVAGLSAVVQGACSTAPSSLHRHLRIGPIVIYDLAGQVAQIAFTVLFAVLLRNVWALVIGPICGSAVQLVISHTVLSQGRNGVCWDRDAVRDLVRFGRWVFIGTALSFLVAQGDKLILGKVLSDAELGLYGIAFMLAGVGLELIRKLSSKVLFPLYARLAEGSSEELRRKMFRVRRLLMLITMPGFCFAAVFGDDVVRILYDSRYHPAGWMLQALAVGAMFSSVSLTNSPILLARGDSFRHMTLLAARSALLLGSMIGGYAIDGGDGLIMGVAMHSILMYPFLAWAVHRYGVWMPRLDLPALVISSAVIAGGIWVGL